MAEMNVAVDEPTILTGEPGSQSATPTDTKPVTKPENVSYMSPDGSFSENWKELIPEEYRGDPSLLKIKSLPAMTKSYIMAQRMIGKNKIGIPNEASSRDEWNAYYDAVGRPSKPEEYGLQRPEEIPPEMYNDAFAADTMVKFHDIGLNKKQAQEIFGFYNNYVMTQAKIADAEREAVRQEVEQNLRNDWGTGQLWNRNIHCGNIALEKGTEGNVELQNRVKEKFGNDPDFIRVMAALGSQFAEHNIVEGTSHGDTLTGLNDQIAAIQDSPAFNSDTHPDHQRQIELLSALFKKKSVLLGRG